MRRIEARPCGYGDELSYDDGYWLSKSDYRKLLAVARAVDYERAMLESDGYQGIVIAIDRLNAKTKVKK